MKYVPKKVFVLENDTYTEITYEELCQREESDMAYKDKLFLYLHGALMEVTQEDYKDYYKMKWRQNYIDARAVAKKDLYYSALDTDEFSGEDILIDSTIDVVGQVEEKLMLEKLHKVLPLLTEEERLLIQRFYYEEIPETKLAGMYGVTQQAISKRLIKIEGKLKKLLEN